jgi:hypothetical protein
VRIQDAGSMVGSFPGSRDLKFKTQGLRVRIYRGWEFRIRG